jgi:hypothetical protein
MKVIRKNKKQWWDDVHFKIFLIFTLKLSLMLLLKTNIKEERATWKIIMTLFYYFWCQFFYNYGTL